MSLNTSGRLRVLWIGARSSALTSTTDSAGRSLEVTAAQPPIGDPERAIAGVDCAVVGPSVEDPAATILALSAHVPVAVVLDDAERGTGSDAIAAGAAAILRPADLNGDATIATNRLATAVAAETEPKRTRIDVGRRNDVDDSDEDPLRRPCRALVEAVGDPMYVLDASGYCRMANEALARDTEYEREELLGIHASRIIGDENFDRASELIHSLAGTGGNDWGRIELPFENDDGTTRLWEATVVVFQADGDVVGSAGVIRDVSERAARARELAQYETIVETAPIGLFVVDADGTIAWANDEFVDAFAEPASEIVRMPFTTLVERGYFEPEIATNYAEYVEKLRSSDVEVIPSNVRFHAPGGETRQYESYNALLPLEDGEFRGTVHAFRDVTEQRRYRRELERQNERLDQFASLVSHDLRNPLNVAQGRVDVLTGAVSHDSVSEIEWAIDRMEALIEDLLTLARQGRTVGDPEPVDLAAIAGEAWDVVETRSATVDHDVGGTIRADAGRLCELFTNLFRNAAEHAGEDVTVRIGRLDDAQAGGDGGFFVEDDGAGLPDGNVFDVGYTTAADGTGFGLAIVAEVVDAHAWAISAGESESGGARFEIRGVTFLADD